MADRIDWADLPDAAREAVRKFTGPVAGAVSATNGVMSSFASTLHTSSGRMFVKGVPIADVHTWVYRHEAAITPLAPLAPRLLWQVEAGGWLLIGYEYLAGRHPDLAPGSRDLDALVEMLALLSDEPWPEQVGKKPLVDRFSAFLPEAAADALEGRMLAHTDANVFNLLAVGGGMRVLDWAQSCPGPAWADTAFTVPRLIVAGHTTRHAQLMARQVPAYRDADPVHLAVFVRTLCSFWRHRTREAPLPQRVRLTEAAQEWSLDI